MDTIKVKPWSESQGDHVVINAADFDPAVHKRLDDEAAPTVMEKSIDEIKAELTAKGIKFRANASREALVALLGKE